MLEYDRKRQIFWRFRSNEDLLYLDLDITDFFKKWKDRFLCFFQKRHLQFVFSCGILNYGIHELHFVETIK